MVKMYLQERCFYFCLFTMLSNSSTQWLILAGAIIEKRNMGIGPIKIQQPYPHHDKVFKRTNLKEVFKYPRLITLDAVVVVMMVCVDLSND